MRKVFQNITAWTFLGSGAALNDREAAGRRKMSIGLQAKATEYPYLAQRAVQQRPKVSKTFGEELAAKETVQKQDIVRQGRQARENEKKCPYSSLARDGIIEYNGVIFNCDYKHNAITLGDMSDEKKVLNIGLPSGGSLKVNVDNIGSISKAAGMFTPEDLNAIMRAIHQYTHLTRKLYEIEEEENEDARELADESKALDARELADESRTSDSEGLADEDEEVSLISQINAYRTELYHRLLNNEAEAKFQIGGHEMTIKEWNKLIERFDKSQENVLESMREEVENRMEEAEMEKMLQKLFEEREA